MPELRGCTEELIEGMDALHSHACAAQRELFRLIVEADRYEAWRDSGARDLAHWLCMRYGISYWKASRWIAAAHALEELPLLSRAFASGELGIDKVVELTRFATPQTEGRLIRWAQGVSCGAIRHKGDLAHRSIEEAQEAEQARTLSWWYFAENARFGLSAELPAADGAVVAKALERLADRGRSVPSTASPGHRPVWPRRGSRGPPRASPGALVMVCSFHHKLVHDYGWTLRRDPGGEVRLFLPDGTRHRAGPGPPGEPTERQAALSAVG
ncbi:MAG TPA: DUF222 domain-containing protein [Actinomycetota bacterium]